MKSPNPVRKVSSPSSVVNVAQLARPGLGTREEAQSEFRSFPSFIHLKPHEFHMNTPWFDLRF